MKHVKDFLNLESFALATSIVALFVLDQAVAWQLLTATSLTYAAVTAVKLLRKIEQDKHTARNDVRVDHLNKLIEGLQERNKGLQSSAPTRFSQRLNRR